MNHYTYELQNKDDGLKYIGVRSCRCPIKEDSYMSSSKWATKQYLANCTKKILKTFSTRKEAVEHEIYLHNKYDIAVNPHYFNQAKQTATKFDQSGKIYSNLNPNANIINIFNEHGELQLTLNGELTTLEGMPRSAFFLSFHNGGSALGYSKQSRTELRKNIYQQYIGWYALKEGQTRTSNIRVDSNITKEQSIGLSCKVYFGGKGKRNPNAKTFIFKNQKGEVLGTSIGNFEEVYKKLGIPRSIAYKCLKTKLPISTKRIKYLHLNGWTITKKE